MQIIPAWIDRMGGAAVFDAPIPSHRVWLERISEDRRRAELVIDLERRLYLAVRSAAAQRPCVGFDHAARHAWSVKLSRFPAALRSPPSTPIRSFE